jgi:hypothetical protein
MCTRSWGISGYRTVLSLRPTVHDSRFQHSGRPACPRSGLDVPLGADGNGNTACLPPSRYRCHLARGQQAGHKGSTKGAEDSLLTVGRALHATATSLSRRNRAWWVVEWSMANSLLPSGPPSPPPPPPPAAAAAPGELLPQERPARRSAPVPPSRGASTRPPRTAACLRAPRRAAARPRSHPWWCRRRQSRAPPPPAARAAHRPPARAPRPAPPPPRPAAARPPTASRGARRAAAASRSAPRDGDAEAGGWPAADAAARRRGHGRTHPTLTDR